MSLVDAHVSKLPSEEAPAYSEDAAAVLKIVRTHDSILGLGTGNSDESQDDAALLLPTKGDFGLAQALAPVETDVLSESQFAADRLDHHMWQLSMEYENLVAMALERCRLANPEGAGGNGKADLASVREACKDLEEEELTPAIAAALAPAAAREVEVAEMARAVAEAKSDVASSTRRLHLMAEECAGLHGELRQLRSHDTLQAQDHMLQRDIASLEAELDKQGALEAELRSECFALEAQVEEAGGERKKVELEIFAMRAELGRNTGFPLAEEAPAPPAAPPALLWQSPVAAGGGQHLEDGSATEDLESLRREIAVLRAKVTPRIQNRAVLIAK